MSNIKFYDEIKVLDCTLRDGGFALEDADKNGIKTEVFSKDQRSVIADHLVETNAEIIEVGAIEVSPNCKKGFAIYQNIEDISAILPQKSDENQLFAAFYRGPDISMDSIPDWKPGMIDAPRVCIRYSEIEKSLDFCEGLCKKGYKVFIQPMVTVRYTEDQLDLLVKRANEMGAYALYFVDSYGYMTSKDVSYYFNKFNDGLDKNIRIGFHAHNNMEMAFSNVSHFIRNRGERRVIVDSCATGMGQGTGNVQTEVVMNYLNNEYDKEYDLNRIFEVCDIVNDFNVDQLWGYSTARFIPAINKTAYKYAMSLKNQYKMGLSDIQNVLKNMPEDLRYRYTPDNTKELLKRVKDKM
ncbi:hypothetical protein [Butyrivibrio sp. WCD2001]|uniref:hypothetical protein n=1 Tax=Butyrivibrio sp. WCD2001 TaxID=1280681 RepID=UPI00041C821B|nr:hypothetical protein [Butyrivibrio sp. WCD2001]